MSAKLPNGRRPGLFTIACRVVATLQLISGLRRHWPYGITTDTLCPSYPGRCDCASIRRVEFVDERHKFHVWHDGAVREKLAMGYGAFNRLRQRACSLSGDTNFGKLSRRPLATCSFSVRGGVISSENRLTCAASPGCRSLIRMSPIASHPRWTSARVLTNLPLPVSIRSFPFANSSVTTS